jgi:hypothetical protein
MSLFALIRQAEILSFFLCQTVIALVLVLVEWLPHRFNFTCSNDSCELGGNGSKVLPFNVVDEALYDSPPTLLIATVDKFARLPWEDRACAFFGGNQHGPPELVIQDELHR